MIPISLSAEKIHIHRVKDKSCWQMSTQRTRGEGWHIVYGSTIDECFDEEFGINREAFQTKEDPFA